MHSGFALFYANEAFGLDIQSCYTERDARHSRTFHIESSPCSDKDAQTSAIWLHPPAGEVQWTDIHLLPPYDLSSLLRQLIELGRPEVISVLSREATEKVMERIGFSVCCKGPVSEAKEWRAHYQRPSMLASQPSLLVVAPAGPFGDMLITLTALRALKRFLCPIYPGVELTLCMSGYIPDLQQMCESSLLFESIRKLPCDLEFLQRYDGIVDLTRLRATRTTATWIDEMLEVCGIKAEAIRKCEKRNYYVVGDIIREECRQVLAHYHLQPKNYVLFHPRSSTPVRTMPTSVVIRFLDRLLIDETTHVVTTIPVRYDHPRLTDVSRFSRSLEHLSAFVEMAKAFISVDTVTYHIADAVGTPGIVLFTTIEASSRISYYEGIAGIEVLPRDNRLAGQHVEASDTDAEYVEQLWGELDVVQLVDRIQRQLATQNAPFQG